MERCFRPIRKRSTIFDILRYNTYMEAIHSTNLLDLEQLQEAAECLRTLARPVRLRMVQLMLREEESPGGI